MKNDCKPPKCAVVKGNCQCPNPWLEHLAHTAAEREAKGLKRLSIKQHAKAYKKAVKSGRYAAQSSTAKSCKSDTKLLCDWNTSRNRRYSRHESDESATDARMSGEYPPGGWDRDLLTMKSSKIKHFRQHTTTVVYKGRQLVFKEFDVNTKVERRAFLFRTLTHHEMYRRLGDRIPCLYKAYFLERNGRRYGIHIMQCAPGIELEEFMKTERSPTVLRDIAKHMRDMFEALQKAKIWHGDLHAGNWIIDSTKKGMVKSMTLIDFDDSVVDVQALGNKNILRFLVKTVDESSFYHLLLPYLREVGVSVPADIMEWDENDFEREYLHLMDFARRTVNNMTSDPDIKLETVRA